MTSLVKTKTQPYASIQAVTGLVTEYVQAGRLDEGIRRLALDLTSDIPVDETGHPNRRDFDAVAEEIYRDMVKHIAYVRDPAGTESIATAMVIVKRGYGDCDDMTVLGASLLSALGIPTRGVIVAQVNPRQFDHIYLEFRSGSQWKPFDVTHGLGAGIMPPDMRVFKRQSFDFTPGGTFATSDLAGVQHGAWNRGPHPNDYSLSDIAGGISREELHLVMDADGNVGYVTEEELDELTASNQVEGETEVVIAPDVSTSPDLGLKILGIKLPKIKLPKIRIRLPKIRIKKIGSFLKKNAGGLLKGAAAAAAIIGTGGAALPAIVPTLRSVAQSVAPDLLGKGLKKIKTIAGSIVEVTEEVERLRASGQPVMAFPGLEEGEYELVEATSPEGAEALAAIANGTAEPFYKDPKVLGIAGASAALVGLAAYLAK